MACTNTSEQARANSDHCNLKPILVWLHADRRFPSRLCSRHIGRLSRSHFTRCMWACCEWLWMKRFMSAHVYIQLNTRASGSICLQPNVRWDLFSLCVRVLVGKSSIVTWRCVTTHTFWCKSNALRSGEYVGAHVLSYGMEQRRVAYVSIYTSTSEYLSAVACKCVSVCTNKPKSWLADDRQSVCVRLSTR